MAMATKYIGMNFQNWCALNIEDERKINYTMTGIMEGKHQTVQFTSDDEVDGMMMHRAQRSTIKEIRLENNEWVITLEC